MSAGDAHTCRADVDLGGVALPVKAVAGFGRDADHDAHFGRDFKRTVGVTPRVFGIASD